MRTVHISMVVLLVALGAQGQGGDGYSYDKPDKQLGASSGPEGPGQQGYPSGPAQRPAGAQGPATGYPSARPGQQGAAGPGAQGYPAGPGFPAAAGQPQVPQATGGLRGPQGYPSSGPASQQGYPSGPSGPSFGGQAGQGPSGPSFGGQGPSGASFGSQAGQGPSGPSFGGQAPSGSSFQQGPIVGGPEDDGSYNGGDYSAIPGEPDIDYPILAEIPPTSFRCDDQQYPGYYADVETRCQVFHVCANNKTYDFLCPNGTLFHQEHLVCVWWNQFDCGTAPSLFGVNANIYDYSIIGGLQPGGYAAQPGPGPSGPVGQFPGQQALGASAPAGYPSGPSTSAGQGPSGPTVGYAGAQAPAGAAQGPTGQIPSGARAPQAPQRPGPFGGYPSDRPSAGFPSGGQQQPTRDYLPPVNG